VRPDRNVRKRTIQLALDARRREVYGGDLEQRHELVVRVCRWAQQWGSWMSEGTVSQAEPRRIAPALARETGFLLRVAFVRAGEIAASVLPEGTSVRFYGVLQTLTELGPHSQHELSQLLHVNRTMMVALIDAMEEAGLVERRRNPSDRRSYALEPTAAGRNLLPQLSAAVDRAETELTEALTDRERQRLQELLRAAVTSHEERRDIPAGLAERTGYLVSAAHLRVRGRFEELLREAGIGAPDFGTLATIAQSAPLSQQQVAEQLSLTGTAVVQIVDRLEGDGLVERRRNPSDRRSYALVLTPKGRTTLKRSQAALGQANAELAEALGGAGQERELYALLRKLLAVD
jgi:DNA-binding MarR family transcriptional regulator